MADHNIARGKLQLMDLPTDVLCMIMDAMYQPLSDHHTDEYLKSAQEKYKDCPLQLASANSWVRADEWPFNYNKAQAIKGATMRIAYSNLLQSRLINNVWANYGARVLVNMPHTSRPIHRSAFHRLSFGLEPSILNKFYAVAKNPILAGAVRFIVVDRNDCQGVMPDEKSGYDDFHAYQREIENRPYVEYWVIQRWSDADIATFYDEFTAWTDKAMRSLRQLLAHERQELIFCVKNLRNVKTISFTRALMGCELLRLYYGAQHPEALYLHEIYYSILPEAFLEAGVAVGNMFKYGTARYLSSGPTGIGLDAVSLRRVEKGNCTETDLALTHDVSRHIDGIGLQNYFQTQQDRNFVTLCKRTLQAIPLHKNLTSLGLTGVRISLPALGDALMAVKQTPRLLYSIELLNVRAENKRHWRSFLNKAREVPDTEDIYHAWHIQECPHQIRAAQAKSGSI